MYGNIQMGEGALGCVNNADFEKCCKWQHCARCVHYLLEITICSYHDLIPNPCTNKIPMRTAH